MKQVLRKMLLVLAAVSCVMFLWQTIQGYRGDESYDKVAELAFQQEEAAEVPETVTQTTEPARELRWIPAPVEDDDPNMELMERVNLDALREINPDVIGWIMIPDSKVNYPLMQGTDNDFYLKHTWEKRNNAMGSIFLEHQSSPDLTDFNTIVYGHNMNNGSMFASLRRFGNESYRKARPYVYIASDQGVYRYEIYACYKAPINSVTYALGFPQDSDKDNFLRYGKEKSVVEIDVMPEVTDRILTLSTCSGGGYSHRWVVQARLRMVQETVVS